MNDIHRTAIVHPEAKIGRGVTIGAYAIVEDHVTIGEGTRVMPHAFIGQHTTLGAGNTVHNGAVLGHDPQDKSFSEGVSYLSIGDRNIFREYVTVHRAAKPGASTQIGNDNMLMVNSHVAHDCVIGDHVTIANAALLAGHVTLEDHATISGGVVIHQFARIGRFAMIGGNAGISKDVPPYLLVDNNEDLIGSINLIGLRRQGFSEQAKRSIKKAYQLLYLSGLNTSQAVAAIARECAGEEVGHMLRFIRSSERGILAHRKKKHSLAESGAA